MANLLKAHPCVALASSVRGREDNEVPQGFEITVDGHRVLLTHLGGRENDALSWNSVTLG